METFPKGWFSLGNKKETFEDLKDFVLREQLMSSVSVDLFTFIRERDTATVQEAAAFSQYYAEAAQSGGRDVSWTSGTESESQDKSQQGNGTSESLFFQVKD